MEAWILTAVCFTVLWVFWQMLNFCFDLIERAQHRASESRNGGTQPTEGKVH